MKIELEAFRSKNGEIIIADEIIDLKPKFFVSPTVSHRRADMKFKHLTDEMPDADYERDTVTIVFNGDTQDPPKKKELDISKLTPAGTAQIHPNLPPAPAFKDEKEDGVFQHTAILYNNRSYNRIQCPNQIKEMMAGSDPDASVMAYDLLKHHSQELAGFIRI